LEVPATFIQFQPRSRCNICIIPGTEFLQLRHVSANIF
jgi:hypothetical protein